MTDERDIYRYYVDAHSVGCNFHLEETANFTRTSIVKSSRQPGAPSRVHAWVGLASLCQGCVCGVASSS